MKRAEHELRALWGREILQELFETDQGEEWGQRRESLLYLSGDQEVLVSCLSWYMEVLI